MCFCNYYSARQITAIDTDTCNAADKGKFSLQQCQQ